MAQKRRPIELKFHVTEKEYDRIRQKMTQLGTNTMAAYLRRMALSGYVLKLDLPELRNLISLLRRNSANINQIAKRVNATGRVYDADLDDLKRMQEQQWDGISAVLAVLSRMD